MPPRTNEFSIDTIVFHALLKTRNCGKAFEHCTLKKDFLVECQQNPAARRALKRATLLSLEWFMQHLRDIYSQLQTRYHVNRDRMSRPFHTAIYTLDATIAMVERNDRFSNIKNACRTITRVRRNMKALVREIVDERQTRWDAFHRRGPVTRSRAARSRHLELELALSRQLYDRFSEKVPN